MIFCDVDAERLRWPTTDRLVFGHCEVCGVLRVCTDHPASELPQAQPVALRLGAGETVMAAGPAFTLRS